MRGLRILAGVAIASLISYAFRGAFAGGGGATLKDLKRADVLGLSVELPGLPLPLTVPIPPEAKNNIKSMEAVQVQKKNFEAGASRMMFAPGVELSLEGGLDGSIQEIVKKQGLSVVTQERKPVTISGIKGLRCTAVFRKGSNDLEMQTVILAKGTTSWMVFCLYLKNNNDSRATATRIHESIQISAP